MEIKIQMGSKVNNRPIINGLQHKECTKCFEIKELSLFSNTTKGLFGKFSVCKKCIHEKDKLNKEAKKEYDRLYRLENLEKITKYDAFRRIRDKEKIKIWKIQWIQANIEKRREIGRNWAKRNRGYCAYIVRLRQIAKLRATPKWADLEEIKKIYSNRPDGYHVDHIVPLKGKTICGLHVSWNLQYLPAKDNWKKGNKLI